MRRQPVIAIHGGAGVKPHNATPRHFRALRDALEAGYAILGRGGAALDAAVAAVVLLEDSGLFNAGRGAAATSEGRVELDASVMEGASQRAGAIAYATGIRNPVLAARAVMERSSQVLLAGAGAVRLARSQSLALAPRRYFTGVKSGHGTVGAVALGREGRLAAATSTGGYSGKPPGRIGDSPIIGAGTWADAGCAVSCTGQGEYFVRASAASDVSARLRYRRQSLAAAARAVIAQVGRWGGAGGLIALDRSGNVAMPFNTPGMYRGLIGRDGRVRVAADR